MSGRGQRPRRDESGFVGRQRICSPARGVWGCQHVRERHMGFYERRCWVMNDSKETKGDWRWNTVYTERITRKKPVFHIIPSILQGFTGNYVPQFFENSVLRKLCVFCSWFILHALLWTRTVLIRQLITLFKISPLRTKKEKRGGGERKKRKKKADVIPQGSFFGFSIA